MFSKHSSSGWILLGPNLSLLKYFDIMWPRHKSSKIEGSCPPLKIYSLQFHCVCFRFSTVSKKETIYTRCHMKGINVPSHLQFFANLIFGKNSQKFAKNRFKSYNSTANFSILKNRIFRINDGSIGPNSFFQYRFRQSHASSHHSILMTLGLLQHEKAMHLYNRLSSKMV